MAIILDKYAIKEVADVMFYELDSKGAPSAPVLYLDTLKTSTLSQSSEVVDARGGKGNVKILSWDTNKELTIEMEDGGVMKGELYEDIAPKTVENFVKLANSGFYDGLIFHRVIPGFMIQGGCPEGTGMGGPGYTIPGEFTANGFRNDLKHERGVLSMARAMNPNSGGSQFFIMTTTSPHLDGQYASFGIVTEGMETADKIVMSKRNRMDKPLVDQKIKSIRVEE